MYSPIAIRRHNIIDPQLLANFLNTQVRHIRIQLLGRHGRRDGSRQVHQAGRFVIGGITPSIALATLLGAIRVELGFFALRAAAALGGLDRRSVIVWCAVAVVASEAAAITEWDSVCAGLAEVLSPRHACG